MGAHQEEMVMAQGASTKNFFKPSSFDSQNLFGLPN
jgi:hypothetical protein